MQVSNLYQFLFNFYIIKGFLELSSFLTVTEEEINFEQSIQLLLSTQRKHQKSTDSFYKINYTLAQLFLAMSFILVRTD